jgi:hypothetical protein
MIGGIMPKQLTMVSLIGAALLAFGAFGAIVGWPAAPSGGGGVFGNFTWLDQDDLGRRRRELQFLKAAFDRLEAEAQQDPGGPAVPSLRGEQEVVLRHMREVARPLPADAVPGDLRPLLKGEVPTAPRVPVPVPVPASPPPERADSVPISRELQIGLSPPLPAIELGAPRDPGLGVIVLVARPRPRPAPREPATDASAGAQSAAADGKPPAKARPAERPATSPSPPDIIGRPEATRPEATRPAAAATAAATLR